MAIRVSPEELHPTHHIALRDRDGREVGLIFCDDKGDVQSPPVFNKNPVETTALKQTSGASSYDAFDYPYAPVVQDDISGGRGNLDFERDSTKYYDSYRCKSGRANKAYAGPQEQYITGLRSQNQSVPGSVKWTQLTDATRTLYYRFQASVSYTIARVWFLARTHGTPKNLTVQIYSDNAGAPNTKLVEITVAQSRLNDPLLSEWLCESVSQAVTVGTYYWLIVTADAADTTEDHWKIATKPTAGASYYSNGYTTTPTAASFDLYYRLTDANADKTCIMFEYKEQQYFIISGTSGAPRLFMAGDRGAANANTGTLDRLIDGSKNWVTNEHVGNPVFITDGTGKLEPQPWRTVVSNTATQLICDVPWTITHDATTEYCMIGDGVREITGHGLTAPVTDVYVSTAGVIYFCMGDAVTVRRMREYNNAGTWTREYADETSTTKAVFMTYKPQAQKIAIANNSDASGNVSVSLMSNASVPAWGTALTWATAVPIDSKYRRITGLICHPDSQGTEALWIFKTDIPFIYGASGNPYPVNLEEMKTVRSLNNGVRPLRHNVYLYFPMQYGLERLYASQFDDIGPNLNEGLPANRRGPIVSMQGYPGKFFIAINAGAGYSSILDSDGWHERYRGPLGQSIRTMFLQVTPGSALDRLWIFQGNDLIYLPFPSETVNELEDAAYPYTHEFAVTLSRMHAGMFDVQKIVRKIKLQTENLSQDVCWFELDYRLNQDTAWTTFADAFVNSPTQDIDLIEQYGLAGKRLQLRIRGYTTNSSKTPVFLAIIINAVLRTDVKYIYPITFRLMDNEPLLAEREEDTMKAKTKLDLLEDLADATTDSMLKVKAVSVLFDGKVVFLNPLQTRQVRFKNDTENPYKRDVFICSASLQEA